MAKKETTIEDLAQKMDQLSSQMDGGFKEARKHTDKMFSKSTKHTDDMFAKSMKHTDEMFAKSMKHTDEMFAKSMKHTDDALEQIVLPQIQEVRDDIADIKEDNTDHQLQTNRIEQMLKNEVIRHNDHSIRLERLEKKIS